MSIILAENPQGIEIKFDENSHKYFTKNIDTFTSATTLLKQFFPVFDRDNIARRKAEKDGVNMYDLLNEWQRKSDESIILGNMVHKFCEEKLLGLNYSIRPYTEKQKNVIKTADKVVDKLLKNFEFIDSEKIIFSEKYKVAGTIDLLMKRDDTIYVMDWKTNKSIDVDNPFNKRGLNCINHLDGTNYVNYQLQLNLYKYLLLEEKYFDCKIDMKIVHLSETGVKFYPVKNYQEEIKEIIKSPRL